MQKTRTRTLGLLCAFLCFLLGQNLYAQNKEISGTVSDAKGETLIGVFVKVKEVPTVGTATDLDGKYKLILPAGAKHLEFSYMGMKTQEIPIKGAVLDVVMSDNVSELDEIVVIGYGSVKRKDLTGPVASVQGDVLQNVPVANVAEAIAGKLAGVQVATTEGSPDAEMTIRVRGGGSLTGSNTPLFIVDGFPVDNISDIPSSDIESMDVLKDASSTAIYGSRGANGVIIITTKTGQSGKLSVSYNAFFSVKEISKTLDVLSVKDYLNWQYEYALLKNDGDPLSYEKYFGAYQDMDLYDDVKGNNWQDQIFGRTGHIFNHNLSVTGGTDIIKYSFNYSYVNDKAIMTGSDYTRNNFSLKLNHKPIKALSFDYSIRYSNTKVNGGGTNEQNEKSSSDSRMRHSVIYTPIPLASVGSDGQDEEETTSELVNPYKAIADSERKQDRRNLAMSGAVTWEVLPNLKLKSEVGLTYYVADDNRFYGTSTFYVKNTPASDNKGKPAVSLLNTKRTSFRNANTLNYDFKKLLKNKDHSLNWLLGHEIMQEKRRNNTNIVHGLPTDFLASDAFKLSSLGTPFLVENFFEPDDKMVSFFTRGNYAYKSKYLLSGTFRADGSSKFKGSNSWGFFPSVAAAWRISSEKFMEPTQGWLSDLKLRYSIGASGNNNIPSGLLAPVLSASSTSWIYGETSYLSPSKTMSNPDLKWETTYTNNLGLDFTIIGGKLNGSLDLYVNNIEDLLLQAPVPGSGYDYQYRNMGKTQNKGLEIQLNYVAIDKKDYGLSFNFNVGFNKNKIKSLGVNNDYFQSSTWNSDVTGDYAVAIGQSIGQMYGYVSDGRYELSDFIGYNGSEWELKPEVAKSFPVTGVKERPGGMKLKDLDGSGDVTVDDRKIIGNSNPTHTGGFTLNARAHGFDLSAAFNWSVGNDVYNANKIEYTSTGKYQYRNLISEMASGNRWTNLTADGRITNDAAELAELNANTTMWSPYVQRFVFSDYAVEDGSFLRLNTLTLGYTLPADLLKKFGVKSLRFYASAYNVFCITSYSGFDPEVSTRRKTNLTPGVDYSAYPKSRQYLFGMNLNF